MNEEDTKFDDELELLAKRKETQPLATGEDAAGCGEPAAKKQQSRSCPKDVLVVVDKDDGQNMTPPNPRESSWFIMHTSNPLLHQKKFHKKFRRRFRVPYQGFLGLVDMTKEDQSMQRWLSKDAVGNP
jgi:hypothetical protein